MSFSKFPVVVFFIPIALSLAACQKQRPSHAADGVQDGGGGEVQQSRADEVTDSIQRMLVLAKENSTKNVFHLFFISKMFMDAGINDVNIRADSKERAQFQGRMDQLHRTISGLPLRCFVDDSAEKGCDSKPDYLATQLSNDHLQIKEVGDCGITRNDHSDASVSRFAEGAKICFSVPRLQRLPPTVLDGEILALILHELAHIAGFDETVADRIQFDFSDYYASRFGQATKQGFQRSALATYRTGLMLLKRVEEQSKPGAIDPKIWATIGRIAQVVQSFPGWGEPLALRIAYKPHRRALAAYVNSVKNLLMHTRELLAHKDCEFDVLMAEFDGLHIRACEQERRGSIAHTDLLKEAALLRTRFHQIMSNWSAVRGESTTLYCFPSTSTLQLHDEPLISEIEPGFFLGSGGEDLDCERPEKR